MSGNQLVKLKNGAEELSPAVTTTMTSVVYLYMENRVAFFALREICRNENHFMWSGTRDDLIKLSLLQSNGQPHDVTRNVVLSAVTGDMHEMKIVSPLAD